MTALAFDVVVNNADRKGGHVLHALDGAVYGVDHGICLHGEDKLRTVLWGWAAEPLDPDDRPALEGLHADLGTGSGSLAAALADLLRDDELAALVSRVSGLLEAAVMPLPSGSWPAIPWPAF